MSHCPPLSTPGDPRCLGCAALCCHNLVLPMPAPTTIEGIADMRWRLHFDTVQVYASSGRWFMVVQGACRYLDQDTALCRIYADRPRQCRDYNPPICERYVDPAEVRLRTPEDLDRYLARKDSG